MKLHVYMHIITNFTSTCPNHLDITTFIKNIFFQRPSIKYYSFARIKKLLSNILKKVALIIKYQHCMYTPKKERKKMRVRAHLQTWLPQINYSFQCLLVTTQDVKQRKIFTLLDQAYPKVFPHSNKIIIQALNLYCMY